MKFIFNHQHVQKKKKKAEFHLGSTRTKSFESQEPSTRRSQPGAPLPPPASLRRGSLFILKTSNFPSHPSLFPSLK